MHLSLKEVTNILKTASLIEIGEAPLSTKEFYNTFFIALNESTQSALMMRRKTLNRALEVIRACKEKGWIDEEITPVVGGFKLGSRIIQVHDFDLLTELKVGLSKPCKRKEWTQTGKNEWTRTEVDTDALKRFNIERDEAMIYGTPGNPSFSQRNGYKPMTYKLNGKWVNELDPRYALL